MTGGTMETFGRILAGLALLFVVGLLVWVMLVLATPIPPQVP